MAEQHTPTSERVSVLNDPTLSAQLRLLDELIEAAKPLNPAGLEARLSRRMDVPFVLRSLSDLGILVEEERGFDLSPAVRHIGVLSEWLPKRCGTPAADERREPSAQTTDD